MPDTAHRLTILIDSNVFIAAEDHGKGHVHGELAAELLRLVEQLGYATLISHGTRVDVLRAPEPLRSERNRALEKYVVLHRVDHDPDLRAAFPAVLSPNDDADLEVLSSFNTGRAQWLITEDGSLRRRASRANVENVLSLTEAVEMFRALTGTPTLTPPAVSLVNAYQVSRIAPIFASLRDDYAPDFDGWWKNKVTAEDRPVIVLGTTSAPDGLSVLKAETDRPYGLGDYVMKICTFKIDDAFQGVKRGEALLKSCLEYARGTNADAVYLEVLPDKVELLAWLNRFGFFALPDADAPLDQLVLVKLLNPPPDSAELTPLDHAVTYGPGNVRIERGHIVPIQEAFHHLLLPDADPQDSLLAGSFGCGNAIRKAYLSRAGTRKVQPGDALLFMRTGAGPSRITALGIVEDTLVSASTDALVAFVGTRTVYSREQIDNMRRGGNVLALLFRHDRAVKNPLRTSEAIASGALNGTPQTITQLSPEGLTWVRNQLGV